jgi:hypothetical protein
MHYTEDEARLMSRVIKSCHVESASDNNRRDELHLPVLSIYTGLRKADAYRLISKALSGEDGVSGTGIYGASVVWIAYPLLFCQRGGLSVPDYADSRRLGVKSGRMAAIN